MILIRHLLSILLLPFLVVVVVPYWLLNTFTAGDTHGDDGSIAGWLLGRAGVVFLVGGLGLFGWCVTLFARIGRGTLAPWDPTRNLVALGPYRYIRNPMISGVVLMLLGQALLWHSAAIGIWASTFILINHIYFVLLEEPGLERRFGENYRRYKARVPRWLPRPCSKWPEDRYK